MMSHERPRPKCTFENVAFFLATQSSIISGPFQTPCQCRAELNSLFKFDFGTAVARHLKPF